MLGALQPRGWPHLERFLEYRVCIPLPVARPGNRRELVFFRALHHSDVQGRLFTDRPAFARFPRRSRAFDVKELMKEKMIGEDDEHRGEDEIQALTDRHVADIDKVLADKENELMEI